MANPIFCGERPADLPEGRTRDYKKGQKVIYITYPLVPLRETECALRTLSLGSAPTLEKWGQTLFDLREGRREADKIETYLATLLS